MSDQVPQDERVPRYRDLFDQEEHTGRECAYCPICTAIAVARRTRPEVVEHLGRAAREVLLALGILLEEAEERLRNTTPPEQPATRLRRIDIG